MTSSKTGGRPRKLVAACSIARDVMVAIDEDGRSFGVIAAMAGIHAQTLSSWGRGNSDPSMFNLEAVASALGYRIVLEKISIDKPEMSE